MTDPFKRIIVLALQKARRPLSTSEVAKRTRMDWATAKARLESLHNAGVVRVKKLHIKNVKVKGKKKIVRVPTKTLWSTRKINL
ncbi:MAG TPA: winged helix-turn-helix transcriptional regulator [bacterium]|nr:winged helix-turn-helix transcriptional regulator [bacterium]